MCKTSISASSTFMWFQFSCSPGAPVLKPARWTQQFRLFQWRIFPTGWVHESDVLSSFGLGHCRYQTIYLRVEFTYCGRDLSYHVFVLASSYLLVFFTGAVAPLQAQHRVHFALFVWRYLRSTYR